MTDLPLAKRRKTVVITAAAPSELVVAAVAITSLPGDAAAAGVVIVDSVATEMQLEALRAQLIPEFCTLRLSVQNMVYTGVLNTPVSGMHLARKLIDIGIQWCPPRLIANVIRISNPNVTLLVYKNGEVVSMGSRQPHVLQQGLQIFVEQLHRIGYTTARFVTTKVENIVAKVMIPRRVDLARLHDENQGCVNFVRRQFPGAIIRHPESRNVTAMVFASGCMVIIGARHLDDARRSMYNALIMIQRYLFPAGFDPDAAELAAAAATVDAAAAAAGRGKGGAMSAKQRRADALSERKLLRALTMATEADLAFVREHPVLGELIPSATRDLLPQSSSGGGVGGVQPLYEEVIEEID
jgi:TATA-box binding protein (TBP) (component of TFIID and TFIIIB)